MGDKIIKSPKIRFTGFTDDWEQRKLGEVVEFFSGLTYSPDNVIEDGGTFVLRSSNVKNGEIIDADNVYVMSDIVNSDNVQVGDIIVVVRNGSRGLIGKHAQIKKQMNDTVIGAFMTGVRSETPNLTNAMLDTQQFSIEINKNLGATINQITIGAFKEMMFYMPIDKYEREKVGEFFNCLDNLITLHHRKLEVLKETKKTMIRKMFPKYGEIVPEIRFEGFTDAWEQRKFSELYQKINEKNDLSFGPEKIISVANMYYKKETNTNSTEEYMKTYNIFRLGDIAFEGNKSKNYSYGRFVENDIGDGIVSHVFDVFRPIVQYDLWFWKYLINNENVMAHVLRRVTTKATMMNNLVAKDFLKAKIFIPNIDEQVRIGEYFKQLENIITHQQCELDLLKDLKKSMLQQMFI